MKYVCVCPHADPLVDAMASLSAMIVLKHDLLLVPCPDFCRVVANSTDAQEGCFRPWYFDLVFSSMRTRKALRPFKYDGRTFRSVDTTMKSSVSLGSVFKNFERAMEHAEVDHAHVLHLPRVFGVLRNGFNG